MAKQSLLDKAKASGIRHVARNKCTKEEIELALAWVANEISLTQVAAVMGHTRNLSTTYVFLARALRQYLSQEER